MQLLQLTHLPLVPHICVDEIGHHWFKRLFGTKPLPEPMLVYCQLDSGISFKWNLNRNLIIFIQENAFENAVCQYGGHFVQEEMS